MFSDNEDDMVALLREIAANTGGGQPDQEVTIEGRTADGRVGLIPMNRYLILESDDLNPEKHPVTTAGTVVLEPGESQPLVRFDVGRPGAIYALGATDGTDVQYELKVDGKSTVGGRTNSPLGVLNSPFSFVQMLGGAIPCDTTAEYIAHYDSDATGTIELAGRMHLEVM